MRLFFEHAEVIDRFTHHPFDLFSAAAPGRRCDGEFHMLQKVLFLKIRSYDIVYFPMRSRHKVLLNLILKLRRWKVESDGMIPALAVREKNTSNAA